VIQTAAGSSDEDVLAIAELETAVSRLDLDWAQQKEQFMVSGILLHCLFRSPTKDEAGCFPAHEGQWLAYGVLGGIWGLFSLLLVAKCGAICWLFVVQATFMVGCSIYGASRANAYHRAAAAYRESRGRLTAKIGEFQAAGRR
jgi:sulfite exporter TauE/SafE